MALVAAVSNGHTANSEGLRMFFDPTALRRGWTKHQAAVVCAVKATLIGALGSFVFLFGWRQVEAGASLLRTPGTWLAVASVVVGTAVFIVGLRAAGVRRHVLGGLYTTGLLLAYVAYFASTGGADRLPSVAWPAIAAQLALVYAIHQGPSRPRLREGDISA